YLLAPALIVYTLVMAALVVYIFNMLYLALVGLVEKRHLREDKGSLSKDLPFITVQLPIFNERYVAERLLRACAVLDDPRDLFEIQALDDSTDDTVRLVAGTVRRLQAEGVDAGHIHRKNREGFKAGALANALASARGEFIAIFDA